MTNTTRVTGEFGELRFKTEMVDVTSNLPKPDKNWRFTDTQGHEHAWSSDAFYPTLRLVVDQTYWCLDCNDKHDEDHFECVVCGEVVKPGMLPPSRWTEYEPGRRQAFLNGEPISDERAQEIIAQMRQRG